MDDIVIDSTVSIFGVKLTNKRMSLDGVISEIILCEASEIAIAMVIFTASQGLAIYVVMRCRKYVAAKIHWKRRNNERSSSMIADGVTIE
ncbi:hypothetical protein KIN20_016430 [Parelaphostrongylus tenuis]|uniref:Uncharacterized protein n=1 Tax=Parelaphostrongylus tenuis TaxID=148309 RepID=A0AAD5N1Y2_PARTN|nr:hypothetical protein KIN20_016430 [Parelaphostrongylus tenuis]